MEGLLHPVGPEDVRTYWIRRGGVLTVLLVLIIGLGLVISNLAGTEGNATPAETTAVPLPPAQAAEPAATDAPPPAPEPPGGGVPDDVTDAEAVPVPSSARTTASATGQESEADERSGDFDSQPGAKPEPEPANTFYLNEPAPSPTS